MSAASGLARNGNGEIVPKRNDAGMSLLRRVGETETYGNAAWQHPWIIRNIMCPDGRRRTAYLGQDADTFFSWPARVKIAGKWVRGFVSGPDAYLDETEPKFIAQHNGHADSDTPPNCSACWLAARMGSQSS